MSQSRATTSVASPAEMGETKAPAGLADLSASADLGDSEPGDELPAGRVDRFSKHLRGRGAGHARIGVWTAGTVMIDGTSVVVTAPITVEQVASVDATVREAATAQVRYDGVAPLTARAAELALTHWFGTSPPRYDVFFHRASSVITGNRGLGAGGADAVAGLRALSMALEQPLHEEQITALVTAAAGRVVTTASAQCALLTGAGEMIASAVPPRFALLLITPIASAPIASAGAPRKISRKLPATEDMAGWAELATTHARSVAVTDPTVAALVALLTDLPDCMGVLAGSRGAGALMFADRTASWHDMYEVSRLFSGTHRVVATQNRNCEQ